MKPSKTQFCILDDISGTMQPGRITLLLGSPVAGKSTLLNALAGRLQKTAMHVSRSCTGAKLIFQTCAQIYAAKCIVVADFVRPCTLIISKLRQADIQCCDKQLRACQDTPHACSECLAALCSLYTLSSLTQLCYNTLAVWP